MSREFSDDEVARWIYREAVYYEPEQLREEQIMKAYAADPMGVLAEALMNDMFGGQQPWIP